MSAEKYTAIHTRKKDEFAPRGHNGRVRGFSSSRMQMFLLSVISAIHALLTIINIMVIMARHHQSFKCWAYELVLLLFGTNPNAKCSKTSF
jgi:hypothetical protein